MIFKISSAVVLLLQLFEKVLLLSNLFFNYEILSALRLDVEMSFFGLGS